MSDMSGRDRVGEHQRLAAAAERRCRVSSAMNDQVTASVSPRAASARLARRVRSWIGVSTGLATVGLRAHRRRRYACRRR